MIGTKLAHYEITAHLGTGGMGEVYQATDTKLGRSVAIKFLPEAFSHDTERVARFQREARVLASLNHSNIAAIHGFEEIDGRHFLVMELVSGETLADRIKRGAIPVEEALPIAKQIAEALEEAHEKGIIHRDLKPANIKVTPDGKVKVLDFGLAKAYEREQTNAQLSNSPTISLAATQAGIILGTAAYMSPEQARGRPVDKRTDIWAFGVVLYELLTGKPLFRGDDLTETLAAVVKDQPDLNTVPAEVRPLLQRCLGKDPKKRLRDIADAMPLLDFVSTDAPVPAPHRAHRWLALALTLAGVFLVSSVFLAILHFREETSPPPQLIRFHIYPPDKTVFAAQPDNQPAISPDGKLLAFFAASQDGRARIWVRDLGTVDARPLAGSEEAMHAFWSPDSRWIAFRAGGELKKIAISGGPTLTLCACFSILHGAWSKEGVILFGNSQGIWKVSENGGAVTQITAVDGARGELVQLLPSFLPDGRHFLYDRYFNMPDKDGTYIGSLDAKPSEQRSDRLLAGDAQYAGSGRLLINASTALMTQAFDADKLKLVGEATPIIDNIHAGLLNIQPSTNGVVAYGGIGAPAQLTWFDRQGKPTGIIGAPGPVSTPRLSPDGGTVAFSRYDTGPGMIWLYEPRRGAYQFTFDSDNENPVWSPDGSHLAFFSPRGGDSLLYQKASNGVGNADLLNKGETARLPFDWSRDNKYLIFGVLDPKTKADIWVLRLSGDKKPFPYLNSEFYEDLPRLSPNGQWLAYESDRTGRFEVYVATFTGAPSDPSSPPRGDWQVSTNGGTRPVWSRDGKELFFISADRKLMAVEVSNAGGARFDITAAKPLFDAKITGNPWEQFDVSKDGRFLMPVPVQEGAGTPITVVVNWPSLLKK